jgi:hypothetical protein
MEGSVSGHLTGWSWLNGSTGCSTGLNSSASPIPWDGASILGAETPASELGTSVSPAS